MTNKFKKIQKVAKDIKSIKIQGATNVAKEGMKVLADELRKQKFKNLTELKVFMVKSMLMLRNARETEPMLFNGLKSVTNSYREETKTNKDVEIVQKILAGVANKYLQGIEKEQKLRPVVGAKLIKKNYKIMTHCHSGSVIKVLTTANDKLKNIHVYNTETRPLYQGRKTSQDLVKAKVKNTMVTDDMAPFFIDNVYESDVDIDMVIIGCDAIKLDGSIYNKVGSFSLALSAKNSKVPLYIVGSLTKLDTEDTIKIEKRSGKELRKDAPKKLEIVNYAFDLVPAKFITGIITEHGIIKPKDIKKEVKKHYPWMMK